MSDSPISEAQPLSPPSVANSVTGPQWGSLAATAWVKIGTIAILMVVLFWSNLWRLWGKTNPFTGEANWGHAMFVPLIGLYYLYVNREAIRTAPARASWAGLVVLLAGVLIFIYGIWPGQNDFVKDFGMVVTLFGVVLMLAGPDVMKIVWFPIVFLLCAIPWPELLYSRVAEPLQQLAATVAVNVLEMTGVKSFAFGTKIFIFGYHDSLRTLNVAEACAGLRSLMTFVSVAAAWAFLFLAHRPIWQKLAMTASAVPIAIFCNVMRVSGQGLLDHYVSQQLSESFAHQFVGLIMLIPAFFMILFVGWGLEQLFIHETDEKAPSAGTMVRRNLSASMVPPPRAGPTLARRRTLAETRQSVPANGAQATAKGAAGNGRVLAAVPGRPGMTVPPPSSALLTRRRPPATIAATPAANAAQVVAGTTTAPVSSSGVASGADSNAGSGAGANATRVNAEPGDAQ